MCGHDPDILAVGPAQALPEGDARIILVKDKEMAFLDAFCFYCIKGVFDQLASNTLPAIIFQHRKMMNVSSASIVAAQDSANDRFLVFGDETHPWISIQIGGNAAATVGAAKSDSFAALPQGEDVIVVSHRER